jgi:hypothetical protein
MGEFWQNSPTHDKPTDLLDAISGAHIYGKNIVQAEAFTTLRMNWNEYPGSMKTLGDRVFASGINKMVLHVFVHNPWTNRKPGMTLDGIGLYFQRDQTWFKQSKAWIRYLTRCAALLQLGKPVVDIGVFTGTNYPQRSLLPYQLIETLPGLFGKERVAAEKKRLENEGTPLRTIPDGVTHSANMADPEKDVDAINGYQYDCFNTDVLMAMTVQNKKIYTPGGASYKVLVIPDEKNYEMPVAVKNKIQQLLSAGAVIVNNKISKSFNGKNSLPLPYKDASFKNIGIPRDVEIAGNNHSIAWTHRKTKDADIYFFANQKKETQRVGLIFSNLWKRFKCFDPAYDFGIFPKSVTEENGYTKLEMEFQPNQSLFIVFYNTASTNESVMGKPKLKEIYPGNWELEFLGIKEKSPVQMQELKSWTELTDPDLKYYSGTVNYTSEFLMDSIHFIPFGLLNLEEVNNIATVSVNGKDCGTLWTYPYNINISDALKPGKNTISISVSNTWHNRLIGDQLLPTQKRTTFTTAPFYLKNKELEPAGITGTVKIIVYDE